MRSLGKTKTVEVRDEWRCRRNNLDLKKERWIGKTIFFAIPLEHVRDGPHELVGREACVALCRGAMGLRPVPLKDIFIPSRAFIRVTYQVHGKEDKNKDKMLVHVTLRRKNGKQRAFAFHPAEGDVGLRRSKNEAGSRAL